MNETVKPEQRIKEIIEIAQSRRKEITADMEKYNKKIRQSQRIINARKKRKAKDPETEREITRNETRIEIMTRYIKRLKMKPFIYSGEHREALQYIDQLQSQDKEAAALYLEEIRKLYRSGTC